MRDLIITENITLDGVIDMAGGWFEPAADEPDLAEVARAHSEAADAFWAARFERCGASGRTRPTTRPASATISTAFTSYVVSSTLTVPGWEPTTVLDLDGILALKQTQGRDIVCTGSLTLVPELILRGLVDEFRLFVYPAVIGSGQRLFERPLGVELAETRAFRLAWCCCATGSPRRGVGRPAPAARGAATRASDRRVCGQAPGWCSRDTGHDRGSVMAHRGRRLATVEIDVSTRDRRMLRRYADANRDHFAGAYMDDERRLRVGFTADAAAHLDRLHGLLEEPVQLFDFVPRHTLSELQALQQRITADIDALAREGVRITATVLLEQANQVEIDIFPLTEPSAALLYRRYGDAVVVQEDEVQPARPSRAAGHPLDQREARPAVLARRDRRAMVLHILVGFLRATGNLLLMTVDLSRLSRRSLGIPRGRGQWRTAATGDVRFACPQQRVIGY